MTTSSTILVISQIALINAFSVRYNEIPEGMMATPHGIRPKQCVHQVKDNNHIIRPVSGGVLVEYPGLNTTEWFPEKPECVENAKKIQSEWFSPENGGWSIYALWESPDKMGNFSATYTVPDESPTNDDQILYYFIGIQSTGSGMANVSLIQPCIGYCPGKGGCGAAYGSYVGWSMSSWNCCPSGESHYGKGVKLEPGVTVKADTYYTGSYAKIWEEYNGEVSQLQVNNDHREYFLLSVSGEFYNYKGCQDFNKKPFMFKDIKIKDLNGANVNPQWQVQNKIKNCGASLKFGNDGSTATMIGAS
eukprot:171382_1